ncbi:MULTISPECIES: hypothetical protein [unclassified Streptomyces]|uniref:hypothetical protein n=1 Tax=unclassified Streptomyces TaxID=2593676 RepID=UPI0035DED87F
MSDVNLDEDLTRLKVLCPPPSRPEPVREVQREPGAQDIPVSHRALITTYGIGCFDEFLWIFAQGAPNVHLDIAERTHQMRSTFQGKALRELSHVLDEYLAGPDDLIQWGATDSADVLAWIARGSPDAWPTVIIQAGQLKAVVSVGSSTSTVLDLLRGSLRIPFFPDDFPDRRPEFSANPYA